jgi:serine/threonine-protein kinase
VLRSRSLAAILVLVIVTVAQGATAPARAAEVDLTVFAGTGSDGEAGDGGRASQAQLSNPTGVAVAADGTVYIADSGNHRVRAVAPGGMISTVVGSGRAGTAATPVTGGVAATSIDLGEPAHLAIATDGTLYVADVVLLRILAVDRSGRVTVIAGTGVPGFTGDGGPASVARINPPTGLAVGPDRTVYFGDQRSHRVRAVSPAGVVTTVAGDGKQTLAAAGGVATATAVPFTDGLAVDGLGNVWISGARVLRRLTGQTIGTVTVPGLAQDGTWAVSTAGTWPPDQPALDVVVGVAASGEDVYAVSGQEIRRLRPGDVRETIAAVGTRGSGQVAVSAAGGVYLADPAANQILVAEPAAAGPVGDSGSRNWWPLLLAGAALVAVVAAVLLYRRRARH